MNSVAVINLFYWLNKTSWWNSAMWFFPPLCSAVFSIPNRRVWRIIAKLLPVLWMINAFIKHKLKGKKGTQETNTSKQVLCSKHEPEAEQRVSCDFCLFVHFAACILQSQKSVTATCMQGHNLDFLIINYNPQTKIKKERPRALWQIKVLNMLLLSSEGGHLKLI